MAEECVERLAPATTALVHGLTQVMRNVEDFTPTGTRLLNPWAAPG